MATIELTKEQKLNIFEEVLKTYIKDYMIDVLDMFANKKQKWDFEVYDELDNRVGGNILEYVSDITKDICCEDIIYDLIGSYRKQLDNLDKENDVRNVEEFEYREINDKLLSLNKLLEKTE